MLFFYATCMTHTATATPYLHDQLTSRTYYSVKSDTHLESVSKSRRQITWWDVNVNLTRCTKNQTQTSTATMHHLYRRKLSSTVSTEAGKLFFVFYTKMPKINFYGNKSTEKQKAAN